MRSEFIISVLFISTLFISCRSQNNKSEETIKPGKDDMAQLNEYFVQKDREIIESFAERKGLKMTESPTGLWYLIKNPGSGELFRENQKVVINYECDLLDGTRCYSSESSGPKEITIGKSKVEQGLNEGLKLMRPGAEAIFIIPPHLGFGLLGDGAKIPPRAIIFYSVSVPVKK